MFRRLIMAIFRLYKKYLLSSYVKYFLHKVQLHVSALDDGHLQVVHEILIKQLCKVFST